MPAFVDDILNRITMYRLVLYYLLALLAAALVLSAFGVFTFSPGTLIFSTLIILGVSLFTNAIFAAVFDAAANAESAYITAFILALIISPVAPTNAAGIGFLVFASAWAMASKYILALGKKHIFNPAAFGVALSTYAIGQSATWWVAGNYALLPIIFLGGILIVRKLRRFDLVATFMAVALLTVFLTSAAGDAVTLLVQTLAHSSFFFLAFVMLTEPLTMPPTRWLRIAYGTIVGFFFAPNIHLGSFYFTPELALLIGNAFAYLVSPKGRFMLTLVEKTGLGRGMAEFVFAPDRPLAFQPGQYLEWTLPHPSDSRGNRRYFTIASSPAQANVSLGVKFYEPSSSFKKALLEMNPGDVISASHVAGDFTLPTDKNRKLAFIAGGIGITPFASMFEYLLDTKEKRPITLLYANRTAAEIAYKPLFDRAVRELGTKTMYALSDEPTAAPGFYSGLINADLIAREIPDYRERLFYISGPHGMVEAFQATLHEMGVPRRSVKIDYFPGFA